MKSARVRKSNRQIDTVRSAPVPNARARRPLPVVTYVFVKLFISLSPITGIRVRSYTQSGNGAYNTYNTSSDAIRRTRTGRKGIRMPRRTVTNTIDLSFSRRFRTKARAGFLRNIFRTQRFVLYTLNTINANRTIYERVVRLLFLSSN